MGVCGVFMGGAQWVLMGLRGTVGPWGAPWGLYGTVHDLYRSLWGTVGLYRVFVGSLWYGSLGALWGLHGALCVSTSLRGSLRGTVALYRSLWVSMIHHEVSMGHYGVSTGHCGSLWISVRSLWGTVGLCVPMDPYVSLWLCVSPPVSPMTASSAVHLYLWRRPHVWLSPHPFVTASQSHHTQLSPPHHAAVSPRHGAAVPPARLSVSPPGRCCGAVPL